MSEFDFDSLISPIPRAEFFSDYWETKPLRISRKQSDYYASVLSGADIDYLLSVACLLDRQGVELIGAPEHREAASDKPASAVYQAYRHGASIRIRGVNRYWKPLWNLCLRTQELFGFHIGANLYCTPANSYALDRHYDLHDTVILQIAGSKNWRVFGSPIELPLDHVPLMKFETSGPAVQYREGPVVRDVVAKYEAHEPLDEFVLEPGDLLYLPRGFVHEAWSPDTTSAHVTIGIYPVTWVDLISVALGQLAHKNARLRKAIPVGFHNRSVDPSLKEEFDTRVQELAKGADVLKAVEEINASIVWNQQGLGEGSIAHDGPASIDLETLVERRPGLPCRFVKDDNIVRLTACHGDISLPQHFEPAIRFAAENQSFIVKDIPGSLSEHSKIVLVRRLIDAGFFRLAKPSGCN
jgi:hypothetical protein